MGSRLMISSGLMLVAFFMYHEYCVKSLRSSYTGLYPKMNGLMVVGFRFYDLTSHIEMDAPSYIDTDKVTL